MTQGEGLALVVSRAFAIALVRLRCLGYRAGSCQLLCVGHMLLGMCGVVAGNLRLLGRSLVIACAVGFGCCEVACRRLLQMFTGLLVVLLQCLSGNGSAGFGGSQCHGELSELIKACRWGASTACTAIMCLAATGVRAPRHSELNWQVHGVSQAAWAVNCVGSSCSFCALHAKNHRANRARNPCPPPPS